jgi:hypothetical protein
MQVLPVASTAGQIYINLVTGTGATLVSGGGTIRCANVSTSASALGVANATFVVTMSSTYPSGSTLFVQMAHATSSTTPATYNYFNVTVTGLS